VVIYGPPAQDVGEEEGFDVILQNGWNLFSTPILLDSSRETLLDIFSTEEQDKILIILGYENGVWYVPSGSDSVKPLYALYVRVNGTATAVLSPSEQVSSPPVRALPAGVSLIGPAQPYESGSFNAMPLDQALISIREVAGGLTGYIMVVSPGQNQPGWGYGVGGPVKDLLPFKGYWVVMENPDTYFGFTTTPLS